MSLPKDYAARKALPICTGVLDYFPDALAEVARASLAGTKQHNPGEPLHWDKSKSSDEADACVRHVIERGGFDDDGVRHSGKAAWRALAMCQREIDADRAEPCGAVCRRTGDRCNRARGHEGMHALETISVAQWSHDEAEPGPSGEDCGELWGDRTR